MSRTTAGLDASALATGLSAPPPDIVSGGETSEGSATTAAPCPTCSGTHGHAGQAALTFVYALGRIEPRFPRISVEKEFAQAIGRKQTTGKTDRQAFYSALSAPENRYLVRQLCWVFAIQGLETYLLLPGDAGDHDLLLDSMSGASADPLISLVIGVRGPIAPPEYCNGLMIPVVRFDQIYSFDRSSLINEIPRPDKAPKEFASAAGELFERILQVADNAGATDEHRALNYLVVRYPAVYAALANAHARNESLSAVEVHPSPLGGARRIVDVVFTFTNRTTDVDDRQFVRVDVTDEFPFLVTKMSPYLARA